MRKNYKNRTLQKVHKFIGQFTALTGAHPRSTHTCELLLGVPFPSSADGTLVSHWGFFPLSRSGRAALNPSS